MVFYWNSIKINWCLGVNNNRWINKYLWAIIILLSQECFQSYTSILLFFLSEIPQSTLCMLCWLNLWPNCLNFKKCFFNYWNGSWTGFKEGTVYFVSEIKAILPLYIFLKMYKNPIYFTKTDFVNFWNGIYFGGCHGFWGFFVFCF